MDIRQLKYFMAIAEEGQITSAAKKLNMAQPPLSQQLRHLEEELGVTLVERGTRRITLTEAGKVLYNRARQILELTDSTVKEVKDCSEGYQGTLSIGTVSSSGAALLNDKVAAFHDENEQIKMEIYEGNTFALIDLLNKGIIEVGIVRTPFHTKNFECKQVLTEPMIAAIPKKMGWDKGKLVMELDELKGRSVIIYRRFEQLICNTCLEQGFEANIFCKCDDARTALLWANAGAGIAIVPKSAFYLASNQNLTYKEIDHERLITKVMAIWVKDRYISPLARKFIDRVGTDTL